jgi:hypothetical protein
VAQPSAIQELRVTITGYGAETLTPGSTIRVDFTIHKPAGIKVTDSYFNAYAVYYVDNRPIHVSTPILGSSKVFHSPSLDKQDLSEELTVKISEHAPIGQTAYIEVVWTIGNVITSINENENLITVRIEDNVFVAPIVYTTTIDNITYHYLVTELTNYVWTRVDRPDLLYVTGRGIGSTIVPITLDIYVIALIIGSAIICAAVVIVCGITFQRKKH